MKIDKVSWDALSALVGKRPTSGGGHATELEASYVHPSTHLRHQHYRVPDRRIAMRAIDLMRTRYPAMPVSDTLDVSVRSGRSFPRDGAQQIRTRLTLSPNSDDEKERISAMETFAESLLGRRPNATAVTVTEKRLIGYVTIPEYSMRVNLREETERTESAGLSSPYEVINFRLKRRFSFEMTPMFRLDITAVRFAAVPQGMYSSQGMYHQQQRDYTGWFSQHVLGAAETYEFEVELVKSSPSAPGDISGVSAPNENDTIARGLMQCFSVVLKVIDDSEVALSLSEKHRVMEMYWRLLALGDDAGAQHHPNNPGRRPNGLVAPKPATLDMSNLLSGASAIPGAVSITDNKYTVTEKADGERRLMVVDDEGRLFTLDDRLGVHAFATKYIASTEYRQCLLDGEYVVDHTGDSASPIFAVFDVYVANGKSVAHLPLVDASAHTKKKKKSKSKEDETCRLEVARNALAGLPDNFFVKTFMFSVEDTDTSSIFQHAAAVLRRRDSGLYPYHIDGLVFTPADLPVGGTFDDAKRPSSLSRIRTWREVLKWKPPEDSTIDFLVRFTDTSADSRLADHETAPIRQRVDLLVGYNTDAVGGNDGTRDLRSFLEASASEVRNTEAVLPSKTRYQARPFAFLEPPSAASPAMPPLHTAILPENSKCENGDLISDGMVVEFAYRNESSRHSPANWVPKRIRYDKTESAAATGRVTANNYETAMNVWRTIMHPVYEAIITGEETLDEASARAELVKSVYFITRMRTDEGGMVVMRKFHSYVKAHLISSFAGASPRIFDFGVGKAGDLHKWIRAGASKVAGIDKFSSNLTDPVNGAYARALQTKGKLSANNEEHTIVPEMLFFPFDATTPIYETGKEWEEGSVAIPESDRLIVSAALHGNNDKTEEDATARSMANFAKEGTFDLATCMFAIHYFFESPARLSGLCRNVAAVLRPGGTFVGISPDGDAIAEALSSTNVGEFVEGRSSVGDSSGGSSLLWRITKRYAAASAKNKYGRQVDVFVESIGQDIPEFLMDYKELVRAMGEVGMRPLTSAELKTSGLGRYSTGMIEPLFDKVVGKVGGLDHTMVKVTRGGAATQKLLNAPPALREMLGNKMTPEEKQYSFLSRWFAFRKKDSDV